jgi:hypothetical protein
MKKHLSQKYFFSIKEKKENKSIGDNILINEITSFYDDIQQKDLVIRNIKKNLNRVKSATIKECVYTNNKIPIQWKKKKEYENKVLNLFSQDKKFLLYVGKIRNIKNYNTTINNNDLLETKSTLFNTSNSNFFSNKSNTFNNNENNKNIKSISIKLNKLKKLKLPDEEEKEKLKGIFIRNKFNNKKKGRNNIYSEKEILSILEDYDNAFPIKEKMDEIIIKKNKENLSKTLNDNFNNFQKMKKNERQEFFRQNIFNKFIPLNLRTQSSNIKKSKSKIKKENNKLSPFLNSTLIDFEKKIEIKNPIVKKNLESINFYGPYYSHCPPCGNKNLEYFKRMNQENAIKLIHFIKKSKGKSTIINFDNNIFENKEKKKLFKSNSFLNSNYKNDYFVKSINIS